MAVVKDFMQRDVVTIPPDAPISDLIRVLDRTGITGAPVVDEQDALVGVVSIRDVLRLARELSEAPEAMRWSLGTSGPVKETSFLDAPEEGEFFAYYVTPGGGFVDVRSRIRELPSDLFDGYRVEDVMTREPVTIGMDASLAELSRLLLDRKLHRALVVEGKQLVGIVTTTDVLRHLAEG
jgi:CBS domain-containing protein